MHPERHKVYEEYKILKGQTIKKRRISFENGATNEGNGLPMPTPRRRRSANGSPRNRNGAPGPGRGRPKSSVAGQDGAPMRRHTMNPQQLVAVRRRRSQMLPHSGYPIPSLLNPAGLRSRKKELDEIIFSYLVQSISPPATVESPHFINLVNGLTASNKKLVSKKSVQTRITMQALVQRKDITRILSNVDYLCVTVDMWALNSDAASTFIAMTAHWIGADLKIQSVLLSCRRFLDDPTYYKVVDTMFQILNTYNIQNEKICCLVTSTGTNLLPTRIYQIQHLGDAAEDEKTQNQAEEETGHLSNDDLAFINLSHILSTPDDESVPLPSHYECPTQTLVNVLTTSIFEALSKPDQRPTSYIFQLSIAKCQALWKACSYKEAEDRVQELFGVKIVTPIKGNWNSFIESITSLISSKSALSDVFQLFELPKLEDNEWDFLEEYVLAMTPITKALNVLHDENDLYMGSFVPTILTVKTKLEEMLVDEVIDLARPIVETLLNALNGPFSDIISLTENARPLILASILHPFFKLRWIPEEKVEELKGWFLEEAMSYGNNSGDDDTTTKQSGKRGRKTNREDPVDHDFFPFSSERDTTDSDDVSTSVLLEFIQYLDDPCEKIESGQLDKFPNVKKSFITFNTAIASSVPVERLIKFAEVSQAPSPALLKDELLENMLLLKCN